MRDKIVFAAVIVAALLLNVAAGMAQQPPAARVAQDSVEKTIGAMVVSNAQCSAQVLDQAGQIATLNKQVADLKAKYEPKPDANGNEAKPKSDDKH